MNIVNLLGLIWMALTWSLLKLVRLPEDHLQALRSKKKPGSGLDLSDHALKSTDSFNEQSVSKLKIDLMNKQQESVRAERVD